MATSATGTPSTNLAIPKINTAVDAPDGKGVNSIVDAIDTLFPSYKVSGIVSGEVPVWNGTAWVRSSATPITANGVTGLTGLTQGLVVSGANTDLAAPPAAQQLTLYEVGTGGGTLRSIGAPTVSGSRLILRAGSGSLTLLHNTAGGTGQALYLRTTANVSMASGDIIEFVSYGGLWVEVNRDYSITSGPTITYSLVSSPPGSPANGDIWYAVDSTSAPTYQWQFRYNSSEATYKWEFVGGADATAEVGTDQSTTTTSSWLDLATVGPTFTVPRAGVYRVRYGFNLYSTVGNAVGSAGVAIGATSPTVSGQWQASNSGSVGLDYSNARIQEITCAASDVLRLRYFLSTASTTNFRSRWISIVPRLVS